MSKIKERIEKLFRKARSAEEIGSLEEAATFTAKAQELLVQYNLELSDLEIDGEQGPEIIRVTVELKDRYGWAKTDGDWLIRLHNAIAHFNFCKLISHSHTYISLIGEQHNIDMVEYICSNVIPTIKALRLKAWREYTGTEKTNTFKRGYYRGAVSGLFTKLHEQRKAEEAKYSGLTGLIVRNDEAIQEKTSELFPNLKTRTTRRLRGSTGLSQGFQDGKNIQINKGVGGRSSNTKMLN